MVLAIGIVVDDAIVVVENVERNMQRRHDARATRRMKTMDEVGGALIAIALVLCAVFIPTAFIPGITGQFYRQFAVTIAVSTVISAFCSLTLSPALAADAVCSRTPPRAPTNPIARAGRSSPTASTAASTRRRRSYGGRRRFLVKRRHHHAGCCTPG